MEDGTLRHSINVKFTLIAVFSALFGFAGSAYSEGTLNVYNWAEYIGEDTISNFEAEFGIDVTYDNYDSVETVDAKLLAGNSGYDVVSHSGSQVAKLIPTGVITTLDTSRLPNMKHLSEAVVSQIAEKWDPDNNHFIPYMWGTHGVTYNEELIRSVFPDAPIGSMDLIFKPENMEKLAECGVSFLDSPTDVIPMALSYMGLDPNTNDRKDYKAVLDMLLQIRPYIKTFDNYAYQRMVEKEFCLAVTWGPDGLLAISTAEEAGADVTLNFFLPPGDRKANLWVDGWVIPSDAKNVDNAYLFLNYMMRPEVAAGDSDYTWYATANADAVPLIDPAVTSSEASFPPPEAVARMYTLEVLPPKVQRVMTRTWTNFKAGN